MLDLIDSWIKSAVEHKTLQLEYYSKKDETTLREVEPDYYGWSINKRNFGFWGFCRLRKGNRCFKKEGIVRWNYIGNDFSPNPYGRWEELIPIYKTKKLDKIKWK